VKVLVTGGAGFIGSHIAERFVTLGHEVVVLDDLSTGSLENVPGSANFLKGDVTDARVLRSATKDVEMVFHEAGVSSISMSIKDPVRTDRVNAGGTVALLVAARDSGVRRIIFARSSSVYGSRNAATLHEHLLPKPESPYAASKLSGEHYIEAFNALFGIEAVILRYFNIFGPRQTTKASPGSVIPSFFAAALSSQPLVIHGDGSQTRDFVYVSDVVLANELAAQTLWTSASIFNVASGDGQSIASVASKVAEITGCNSKPSFAAPRRGDVSRSVGDTTRARRDLGFKALKSLEEGLVRTASWLAPSTFDLQS
jgi:UDP-glucose 4-epimerase